MLKAVGDLTQIILPSELKEVKGTRKHEKKWRHLQLVIFSVVSRHKTNSVFVRRLCVLDLCALGHRPPVYLSEDPSVHIIWKLFQRDSLFSEEEKPTLNQLKWWWWGFMPWIHLLFGPLLFWLSVDHMVWLKSGASAFRRVGWAF